jgi:hypothetical protein
MYNLIILLYTVLCKILKSEEIILTHLKILYVLALLCKKSIWREQVGSILKFIRHAFKSTDYKTFPHSRYIIVHIHFSSPLTPPVMLNVPILYSYTMYTWYIGQWPLIQSLPASCPQPWAPESIPDRVRQSLDDWLTQSSDTWHGDSSVVNRASSDLSRSTGRIHTSHHSFWKK